MVHLFPLQRVTVIGDAMLDHYIFGSASRISPEAPVMVIDERSTLSVPGGAANVAINLRALGAQCNFVGVVGDDLQATMLSRTLDEKGINANSLVVDPSRPTTLKTRIVANHSHQVLRIDRENRTKVNPSTQNALLAQVMKSLEECDLLMISDYAKGCLTEELVQQLIDIAKNKHIPVVANPKPSTAAWYRGASLLSLNQFEAAQAAKIPEVTPEIAIEVASNLRQNLDTQGIIVTLRENGMAGSWDGLEAIVPAIRVEVYDEAGAGDTAIATLALAISTGADGKTAMELAVRTAAIVVTKVGVASVSQEELLNIANERVS